jgi:hypothetical protein
MRVEMKIFAIAIAIAREGFIYQRKYCTVQYGAVPPGILQALRIISSK